MCVIILAIYYLVKLIERVVQLHIGLKLMYLCSMVHPYIFVLIKAQNSEVNSQPYVLNTGWTRNLLSVLHLGVMVVLSVQSGL